MCNYSNVSLLDQGKIKEKIKNTPLYRGRSLYRGVFQLNTKEVDAHDTPQHKLSIAIASAASTAMTEEKRGSTHVLFIPW